MEIVTPIQVRPLNLVDVCCIYFRNTVKFYNKRVVFFFKDTLELSGVPEAESSTDPPEYLQLDDDLRGESSTEPSGTVEPSYSLDAKSSTDTLDSAPAEPDRVEIQITGDNLNT